MISSWQVSDLPQAAQLCGKNRSTKSLIIKANRPFYFKPDTKLGGQKLIPGKKLLKFRKFITDNSGLIGSLSCHSDPASGGRRIFSKLKMGLKRSIAVPGLTVRKCLCSGAVPTELRKADFMLMGLTSHPIGCHPYGIFFT
jgi:hypothetical protein